MGRIVVARWNEGTEWHARAPWPVAVVQKNVDLPNTGREATSYLWFMMRGRKVLDALDGIEPGEVYAFVQGDPFAHGFAFEELRAVDRFVPLGAYRLAAALDGAPNHPGLPLERCAREWLGIDLAAPVRFTAGAQFLVPGEAILEREALWPKLYEAVLAEELGPWVMERLWPYVFGAPGWAD